MTKIFFILFLTSSFCFAQENFINSHDDIYIREGLLYKVKDNELFTGIIEFIKKNNVLTSKEIYKNGYKISDYEYYNKSASGKIYKETVYYKEKFYLEDSDFKKQKIILYHSSGEIYSVKHYDLEGNKFFEEEFKKGKLTYSCEFKNGKKDGKEFCASRKSANETITYSKGKKIK